MKRDDEDFLTEGMKPKTPEMAAVAIRLRRIALERFNKRQADLHRAMGGETAVRRTELSTAWNGRSLCGTDRWTEAVAKALGVDWPTARAYIDGTATLAEVSKAKPEPYLVQDRYQMLLEVAEARGWSLADARRIGPEVAAYKGTVDAEQIERLFTAKPTRRKVRETVIDDDIGPGTKSVPKPRKGR